ASLAQRNAIAVRVERRDADAEGIALRCGFLERHTTVTQCFELFAQVVRLEHDGTRHRARPGAGRRPALTCFTRPQDNFEWGTAAAPGRDSPPGPGVAAPRPQSERVGIDPQRTVLVAHINRDVHDSLRHGVPRSRSRSYISRR